MVAITVILAAVIGTFVLGLGDQVQQTAPNAQFSWAEESEDGGIGDMDADTERITILTHESGDSVNTDRLTIRVDGDELENDDEVDGFEGTLTAGSQIAIGDQATFGDDNNFSGGETIRVVWQSQDGDRTATLTSFTVSDDFVDTSA